MNISDFTAYADKQVGQTLAFSFGLTGSPGGPTKWTILNVTSELATITTAASGTGSTFGFTAQGAGVGEAQFVVQAYDTPTGQYVSKVVSLTVVYSPITVRTFAAPGTLDDTNSFQMTKVDTSGGAVTIPLTPDPAGRGWVWWVVKNYTGANNVTITVPSGKSADGTVDGTFVLLPGDSIMIFSDNSNGFDSHA